MNLGHFDGDQLTLVVLKQGGFALDTFPNRMFALKKLWALLAVLLVSGSL